MISGELKRRGIEHAVLNAKPEHARTRGRGDRPGRSQGRGDDRHQHGRPRRRHQARRRPRAPGDQRAEEAGAEPGEEGYEEALAAKTAELEPQCEAEAEEVRELGGLFICGTERHESRRIDNQLRGRSGRQGDPGETRFFLSAEDDVIRLFAGDRIYKILDRLGPVDEEGEEMPLEAKMLTKTVEGAQKKVEEQNFLIRKRVLEYDDVMNEQRRVVYKYRREILEGRDMSDIARDELEGVIERLVDEYTPGDELDEWDMPELEQQLRQVWPVSVEVGCDGAGDGRPRKAQRRARRRRDGRLRRAREAARRGADALPGALDPAAGDRQPLARAPLRHGLPARRDPPARLRPDRSPGRLQKRRLRDVRGADALDLGGIQQADLQRPDRTRPRRSSTAPSPATAAPNRPASTTPAARWKAQPSALQEVATGGGTEVVGVPAGAAAPNGEGQGAAAPQAVETVVKDEREKNIGSNDPCWCGSGKKYKKCHGA